MVTLMLFFKKKKVNKRHMVTNPCPTNPWYRPVPYSRLMTLNVFKKTETQLVTKLRA